MATKTKTKDKEKKKKKSKDRPDPEVQEFNNHKILNLEPEVERRPFSFGVRKAKLILEYVDEIQAFVDKFGDDE